MSPSPTTPPSTATVSVALASSSPLMTAGLSSMLGDRRDLRLSAPPVQGGTAPRGALLYDVGAPPSSYVDLVRQSRSAGWVVLALAWPEESRRELRQPTGPAPDAAGQWPQQRVTER